jgi:transcriptional regulator with XRE-family HTH domain
MSTSRSARTPGRGPADRARLAAALREARHRSGLTGTQAGTQAGMSHSKVSKIERGFLLPSVADVEALSRVYKLPKRDRDHLLALVQGLRREQSTRVILPRGMAEQQRRIGQLEASCTLIRGYQPVLVDGLLQTDAYMRLVFGVPGAPPVTDDDITAASHARRDRQRLLDDESKRFELVMTEGAIRWQAGSAALMVEQTEAIAEAAKRPNMRLGIIPWTAPVDIFPPQGFHIYDEDAVIIGTLTGAATLTSPGDVAMYLDEFAEIERLAAFGDEAQEHLARIAAEYRQLESA